MVHSFPHDALPIYIVATAVLYPLIGFTVGLYRSDHLALWASAVSEVSRGAVTVILTTWPVYGVTAAIGLHPLVGATCITIGALILFMIIARTFVRSYLHSQAHLRQRTVILGSGLVAGQLVEKIGKNNQFGLDPVGIVDDQVHLVGTPDLPRLGGFGDLDEVIKAQNIDRVIIA